jgi:hypothetical protein
MSQTDLIFDQDQIFSKLPLTILTPALVVVVLCIFRLNVLIGLSQVSDELMNSLRNPCDNCIYVQDWKSGLGGSDKTKSVHSSPEDITKIRLSGEKVIQNATWKCSDGENYTLHYSSTDKKDNYRLTVHIANIMYSAFKQFHVYSLIISSRMMSILSILTFLNHNWLLLNALYVFCTVYLLLTLPVNLGFIMITYCSHESLLKCLGKWSLNFNILIYVCVVLFTIVSMIAVVTSWSSIIYEFVLD